MSRIYLGRVVVYIWPAFCRDSQRDESQAEEAEDAPTTAAASTRQESKESKPPVDKISVINDEEFQR